MKVSARLTRAAIAFWVDPAAADKIAERRLRGIIAAQLRPLNTCEQADASRRDAALSLMDDEVLGFSLITIRGSAEDPTAEVISQIHDCLWPEVVECMATLATDVAEQLGEQGL